MKRETDYPPEREDWLMAVDYFEKKSRYGCILCEKTHFIKECPNRVTKITIEKNKTNTHDYNDEMNNPHNYGW